MYGTNRNVEKLPFPPKHSSFYTRRIRLICVCFAVQGCDMMESKKAKRFVSFNSLHCQSIFFAILQNCFLMLSTASKFEWKLHFCAYSVSVVCVQRKDFSISDKPAGLDSLLNRQLNGKFSSLTKTNCSFAFCSLNNFLTFTEFVGQFKADKVQLFPFIALEIMLNTVYKNN